VWAEPGMGCKKIPLKFSQGFGFKIKGFKYFQTEFELGKIGINSNKLFEGFSIMELLEIDLNIQIQSKALNGRLLN
jgi:hypothetical protein